MRSPRYSFATEMGQMALSSILRRNQLCRVDETSFALLI